MHVRRPRTRSFVLLIAIALTLLVIIWAAVTPPPPPPPPVVPPPVDVETEVIEPLPAVADTFDIPGVVEPVRIVEVSAEVAANVEKIVTPEGSRCKEGDPIIILDDSLLKAEFERQSATADFKRAEFERVALLKQQGAGTEQDLDRARSEMLAAQASMELARVNLERSTIYAPIDGVIDEIEVEVGEHVESGTNVARIVENDYVNVVVMVPEIELPFIKLESDVTIYSGLTDLPVVMHGTISLIRALADEKTRATRVEIRVDNRDAKLASGRIVRAQLTRRKLVNVIMVPLAAILPKETGRMVFVVENGIAAGRNVKVNMQMIKSPVERPLEPMIQVTEGLRGGDRLIIIGQQLVGPGQRVNILRERRTGELHFNPGAVGVSQ